MDYSHRAVGLAGGTRSREFRVAWVQCQEAGFHAAGAAKVKKSRGMGYTTGVPGCWNHPQDCSDTNGQAG